MNISKIFLVGKYTFLEILKSKIMFTTFILGGILLLVSSIASEFTYGVPERVTLDFGLGLLTLSSVGISIFMGVSLLANEIESRTIYMVLSRNIRRWEFLCGRILGMIGILFSLTFLLGVTALICFLFYGGKLESLIYWSILFVFFESIIMLAVVILFSLITNKIMTVVYSISLYIVAHSIGPSLEMAFVVHRPFLGKFIRAVSYFFPDFSKLSIKSFVLYSIPLEKSYLLFQAFYSIFYFMALMFLISQIFERKNLD